MDVNGDLLDYAPSVEEEWAIADTVQGVKEPVEVRKSQQRRSKKRRIQSPFPEPSISS